MCAADASSVPSSTSRRRGMTCSRFFATTPDGLGGALAWSQRSSARAAPSNGGNAPSPRWHFECRQSSSQSSLRRRGTHSLDAIHGALESGPRVVGGRRRPRRSGVVSLWASGAGYDGRNDVRLRFVRARDRRAHERQMAVARARTRRLRRRLGAPARDRCGYDPRHALDRRRLANRGSLDGAISKRCRVHRSRRRRSRRRAAGHSLRKYRGAWRRRPSARQVVRRTDRGSGRRLHEGARSTAPRGCDSTCSRSSRVPPAAFSSRARSTPFSGRLRTSISSSSASAVHARSSPQARPAPRLHRRSASPTRVTSRGISKPSAESPRGRGRGSSARALPSCTEAGASSSLRRARRPSRRREPSAVSASRRPGTRSCSTPSEGPIGVDRLGEQSTLAGPP
jgi:hypothetical protein